MKDLFKKIQDFGKEIAAEIEDKSDGVAIIITALDTSVKPGDPEGNLFTLVKGKGVDLLPLTAELLDNDTLKPIIKHAMLAKILVNSLARSEHSESKKEN